MALSGTSSFTLTVNDVIQEAYDRLGGDPILGYDVKSARRSLNIMFSDWANRGYNQWTVEYKTQAITQGTTDYTIDSDTVDIINANIQLAQEEANRDVNAPPIIENNNLDDNNRPRFFGAFMNLPNL